MRKKRKYRWAALGFFLLGFAVPVSLIPWLAAAYFYLESRRLD